MKTRYSTDNIYMDKYFLLDSAVVNRLLCDSLCEVASRVGPLALLLSFERSLKLILAPAENYLMFNGHSIRLTYVMFNVASATILVSPERIHNPQN